MHPRTLIERWARTLLAIADQRSQPLQYLGVLLRSLKVTDQCWCALTDLGKVGTRSRNAIAKERVRRIMPAKVRPHFVEDGVERAERPGESRQFHVQPFGDRTQQEVVLGEVGVGKQPGR